MQIGPYSLGQKVASDSNLVEISPLEYRALPKTFSGEHILKAQDVSFLDRRWNLLLGTIEGRIYKLSAQSISESTSAAAATFSEATTFCSQQFGTPSTSPDGSVLRWDTSFGNVIVDRQSVYSMHCVNFQCTSDSLVRANTTLTTLLTTLLRRQRAMLAKTVIWNPRAHSDEENSRWLCLRAIEWAAFPAYLSQPVAPILFIFYPWYFVVLAVVALGLIWCFVRYSFVSVGLASAVVAPVVWLKWPVAIASSIYLFIQHQPVAGVFALLWPLVAAFTGLPAKTGIIELAFAKKIGFVSPDVEL